MNQHPAASATLGQDLSLIIGYGLLVAISLLLHLSLWLWFQRSAPATSTLRPPKLVTITFVTPSPQPHPLVQPVQQPTPVVPPTPIAKPVAKAISKPKPRLVPTPEPKPVAIESTPASSSSEQTATVPTPLATAPTPAPELVPANTKATSRRNPKPDYPAVAKRRGWEGKVILAIEVLTDGTPGKISVVESSGREILDKAAIETVKRWLFEPARRGEAAVISTFTQSIVFKFDQ